MQHSLRLQGKGGGELSEDRAGGEGSMGGGCAAGGPTLLPKIKIREEEKQMGPQSGVL